MTVRIGHASIDEHGKIQGGNAGDQTGKEVKISNYYVHHKGWVVLRCKDDVRRNLIAEAMEKACKNNQIGYDQYQRDTLFNNVKSIEFDPAKTTKKVETDCSALVRVCIAYAYGADKAGNIRTVNEPDTLVKTGLFTKLTADKYCKSSDYLLRGDILCTPVSGHTVVVLDNGAKAVSSSAGSSSGKKQIPINGIWDSTLTKRLQEIFGTPADGIVSNQHSAYKAKNPGLGSGWDWQAKPNGKGSQLIKKMQEWAGMPAKQRDGEFGPNTCKAIQKKLGTTRDGYVSKPSAMVKALQRWVNKQ